ncbi:hypothetical protein BDV98DRAFT_529953 [Pterulicium gracile]|uniref:SWI/SNF and RSC complexes subunit Ssr4 N-terminal domain-containing protein n=1 Tax=Pterulicium gracile TaxID=1884261 RepID=A0A5C3QGN6_9AGAR|nr:hypothetical protein BDV98DRAFT_529953 [Pterula gracilis]
MSAPQDPPCLQYPEDLGIHTPASMTLEMAANMLQRAVQMAATVPFVWSYIDKPKEGQVALIYNPPGQPFPMDGLRYVDNETRGAIGVPGGRELETSEVKLGFIPGEQFATRTRRTYRLRKGGHPSLVLVHWFRGAQQATVPPHIATLPARAYPLRTITDQPATFVVGEKTGQKIPAGTRITIPGTSTTFLLPGPIASAHLQSGSPGGMSPGMGGGGGMPGSGMPVGGVGGPGMGGGPGGLGMSGPGMGQPGGGPGMGGLGPGMGGPGPGIGGPPAMGGQGPYSPQQMLVQQNANMAEMERRRGVPPGGAGMPRAQQGTRAPLPRMEDDDSGDELESVSTRTLAKTRYLRNHDYMNQVFAYAAYGDKSLPTKPVTEIYSEWKKDEMEDKIVRSSAFLCSLSRVLVLPHGPSYLFISATAVHPLPTVIELL